MAGRPQAPASQPPDPDGAAPNVVARVSKWADDHLRLVRVSQTGRAGGGRRVARSEPEGDVARAGHGQWSPSGPDWAEGHVAGVASAGRAVGEGARPGWARCVGMAAVGWRDHL